MHAEDFQGFAVEQDLQHALRLAGDLRTRHALEEGLAHFVRHLGLGQLLLVLADRADLGNGVDTRRTSLTKRQLPLSTMLPAADRPWS